MENLDFADMIKDIPTESVYVLTEKNADVIKALRLLPGNRPIKAKKVESLIEAYKQGVYIPPILVAVPYRFVTEGNHRLAAALECIEKGIPFTLRVYMYKDDDSLETARLINNSQDRWKARDRLGISFNKFVVRLRKKADTWEEPKDSIEAWFTMYLKVAGL